MPLQYFTISDNQKILEVLGWKRQEPESSQRWLDIFYDYKGAIYGGGLMEFEKYESSINFVVENKKKCVI